MSVHVPERTIDEEGEHKHEVALLGELVGEHPVKRVRRPVVGLMPASSWVGRPPLFGMVARQFLGWQPLGEGRREGGGGRRGRRGEGGRGGRGGERGAFVSPFRELACCNAA